MPQGSDNHNLSALGVANRTVEPGFLVDPEWDEVAEVWLVSDFHLALDSPLVDGGDPAVQDVDGTVADPGIYGGMGGDLWDRDLDGSFDYFWPGTSLDAPAGFDPSDYDSDDLDASVQGGL